MRRTSSGEDELVSDLKVIIKLNFLSKGHCCFVMTVQYSVMLIFTCMIYTSSYALLKQIYLPFIASRGVLYPGPHPEQVEATSTQNDRSQIS